MGSNSNISKLMQMRNPPQPNALAGDQLAASKSGNFSLNGGQLPSNYAPTGNTYSPFANFSQSYTDVVANPVVPNATKQSQNGYSMFGMINKQGGVPLNKGAYNPFFLSR